MTHKQLEDYILSKPGSWLDFPFGEEVSVYKVGSKDTGKMFALIPEGKDPASISLKCDPVLATQLRDTYATVMPGYHLHKKHWNTIVTSGELSEQEVTDLINHSYQLVLSGIPKEEQEKLTKS